jgi:dTDP-4-dehydrorhamnose reductase
MLVACSKGRNRLQDKTGYTYEELDITDAVAVNDVLQKYQPAVIIHAAALTQVDTCEMNKALCWNSNVTATRFLLDAAAQIQSHFIFISTDFVFSGDSGPYQEADETSPVNYYGSSKVAAEKSVMDYPFAWTIVRTVLVYGINEDASRSNIFNWVYGSLKSRKPIKVVNDQFRTPTYVNDLVKGIELIINKKATGIYHLSGRDELTPYQVAIKIAEEFGFGNTLISETNASDFSQPALRPSRTGFIIDKAKRELGYVPVSFEEGLSELKRLTGA